MLIVRSVGAMQFHNEIRIAFKGKHYCFVHRRASELRLTYGDIRTGHDDVDTFEHILNVTSHNEALLAYFYLDGENMVSQIHQKSIKISAKGRHLLNISLAQGTSQ